MAETPQLFRLTEIAELLVKKADIHEGHWGVVLKFNFGAGIIEGQDNELLPTAFAAVKEVGIRKFDEPTTLTVDAALINPRKQKTTRKTTNKRSRKAYW